MVKNYNNGALLLSDDGNLSQSFVDIARFKLDIHHFIDRKRFEHQSLLHYFDQTMNYFQALSMITKHRRNGYGKSVLLTYIDYLKSFGFGRIYIQTWSGNLPMLNLSKKLGFIECSRLKEKKNY